MTRALTFDIVYRYPENAKGITIPVTLISPYGSLKTSVGSIIEDPEQIKTVVSEMEK